jgi:2-methylcitrate dehydratase PrpD
MNFITDYKLENYILNTSWDMFPSKVKKRAIVCGIDLMIALILGSKGKQYATGKSVASAIGSRGDIPIIGTDERFNLFGATLALGHASNSFDIDDGHNLIKGHPGTSFVAGILAASLEKDINYKEYLTTLVIAYDVAVRSGLAMQHHYDYLHSTGAYGAVATAAGISRILKFNKEQLNNALSISDFHAPFVPVMRAVEYPSMNKDGVPFGAITGVLSVIETLNGYTGKTHLLELEAYKYLLETLGTDYEIMNLYFKPFTCCRWAHPPILASLSLIKAHEINAAEIEKVEVKTFAAATRLSKIIPTSTDEAQYNISYPIAAAIVYGDLGFSQVIDENLGNADVLKMMTKIEFQVDEKLESAFPAKRQCIVSIVLKNGSRYTSDLYEPIGEAKDQVDLEWITEKYFRITKPVIHENAQQKILDLLINDLELPVRTIIAQINNLLLENESPDLKQY